MRCELKEMNFDKILKERQQILHFFHITHLDVKPENIMYSSAYQNLVFIDFDFSKLVK